MENRIVTKNFNVGKSELGMLILYFDNAISVYVYEDSPKLGTIGLTVPGSETIPPSTVFLSGLRYEHFVRMFGERIARVTGKLTLVSINVSDDSLFEAIWGELKKQILK
ncbi:MAG: hypothetical protein ACTSQE_02245 [Candidatus Heimdallarchaeaceae archaeon]